MRLTEAQSQGRVGRSVLHADKGYDANAIRRQVEERGATPNIPPKTNRKWKTCFSPFLYRNRNAIERMFRRLEDFRRINVSTVLAGQRLGIKEVDEGIWLVSLMSYDLGLIDLEQKTLQPLDNPFGPRLSPMS